MPDHLLIEDERETVSIVPSSIPQSATQDDSCAGHKVQNAFGCGDVLLGVTFNPARQPKMTCPSTITPPPNKTRVGKKQCRLLHSCLHHPPPPNWQLTSPTHRLFSFKAITSKPTKITSKCAPAKELPDLCLCAPKRICMDNQQDKVTCQLMLWTWGLARISSAFSKCMRGTLLNRLCIVFV